MFKTDLSGRRGEGRGLTGAAFLVADWVRLCSGLVSLGGALGTDSCRAQNKSLVQAFGTSVDRAEYANLTAKRQALHNDRSFSRRLWSPLSTLQVCEWVCCRCK